MDELQKLRQEIDAVDEEWLRVLSERFALTRQVGKLKAEGSLPPVDPKREAEQEARLKKLAEDYGVSPALAYDVLRLVIAEVVKEHNAMGQTYPSVN